MVDKDSDRMPSQNNEQNNEVSYLQQAAEACAAGDPALGMHLYLAAFEQSQKESGKEPSPEAINGMKKAWALACSLKERSIAEYVFERIEPYLSSEEKVVYAKQLQELALDKLEEYGLSRKDLEELADAISEEYTGSEPSYLQVEHVSGLAPLVGMSPQAASRKASKTAQSKEDAVSAESEAALEGGGPKAGSAAKDEAALSEFPSLPFVDKPAQGQNAPAVNPVSASVKSPAQTKSPSNGANTISAANLGTYDDLVGYDESISRMRDMGIGRDDDPQFQDLVELLNDRHGLDCMPAVDSILFRSPAREDANRFMMATAGELGLPVMRMRMEENLQGMPMLVVMTQNDRHPKLNQSRTRFEGPAVLLIEDLDQWFSPVVEQSSDDLGGFLMASLSRGAREAVALIQSAVDNSEVYVLASASDAEDIDPFFYDLLSPLTVVDIDYPTEAERTAIWKAIVREHPSMRGIDRKALVRYSRSMPRCDIYSAVNEAIEEAYKSSLASRRYMPVKADNLFDKLAAYQPLDSEEYKALEDAVVEDFKRELENIDDLLKGQGDH